MSRRVSFKRVKSHFSYTFEEVAEVLGVCVGTVRRWAGDGLPYLSEQRPYLILGWALKDFLRKREGQRGRKLDLSEFYCVSCRAPRSPMGMMADYVPVSEKCARLEAICSQCGTVCNRLISTSQKAKFAEIFDFGTGSDEDA